MTLNYSNRPFKLKVIDLSDDTQVNAAGGYDTQTLTPPEGKIYKIRYLYYNAPVPAGGSSGTHQIIVERVLVSASYQLCITKSVFGSQIWIGHNFAFDGDSSESPSAFTDQFHLFYDGGIVISNSYPLKFTYTNSTDANQTGTRTLEILVEEHKEAE